MQSTRIMEISNLNYTPYKIINAVNRKFLGLGYETIISLTKKDGILITLKNKLKKIAVFFYDKNKEFDIEEFNNYIERINSGEFVKGVIIDNGFFIKNLLEKRNLKLNLDFIEEDTLNI